MLRITSLVLALGLCGGCGSSDSDDEGDTDPVDARGAVIYNIAALGGDIYNTNWAGVTCSNVNKTTTCPGGGSVIITGGYTCPTTNGVQTVNMNFTYEMTDCIEVRSSLTLKLTGKMTHTGSSSSSGSTVTAETLNFQSVGPMIIVGTGDPYKPFNESCEFALTSRLTDGTSKVTGTLCGESIGLR